MVSKKLEMDALGIDYFITACMDAVGDPSVFFLYRYVIKQNILPKAYKCKHKMEKRQELDGGRIELDEVEATILLECINYKQEYQPGQVEVLQLLERAFIPLHIAQIHKSLEK